MVIPDDIIEGAAYLSEADQKDLYFALVAFIGTGEMPEGVSDVVRAAITMSRFSIEKCQAKVSAGRKGGNAKAAKQTAGKRVANAKQTPSKSEANAKQTPSYNKNKNKNKNNETPCGVSEAQARREDFAEGGSVPFGPIGPAPDAGPVPEPPRDLDEVRAYFGANCLKGDPESFFNHYASQGWYKGNRMPVANWRAEAARWSGNEPRFEALRRARGEPEPEQAAWRPAKRTTEDAVELLRRRELDAEAALFAEAAV